MATHQSNSRVRFHGPNNQARAVFVPARDEDGRLQRRCGKAAHISEGDLKIILERASELARKEVQEFLSRKRKTFTAAVRTELAGLCRGYFGVDGMVPSMFAD